MSLPKTPIPIIDLFAGPGGLGEGFAKARSGKAFKIALSIEMDRYAHETLTLRSFYRQFPFGKPSRHYFDHLHHGAPSAEREDFFLRKHPAEWERAKEESLCLELGPNTRRRVDAKIGELGLRGKAILIGGPPCQAYSLAGRSRNKGTKDYRPEDDNRHFLYREYLRILANVEPIAFVMENVKGILSSKIAKNGIFDQILRDLQDPGRASKVKNRPKYHLFPIAPQAAEGDLFGRQPWSAKDFIVRAERYGVPQSRHRVIVIGIREDQLRGTEDLSISTRPQVNAWEVLKDIPNIHPWNSRGIGTREEWQHCVKDQVSERILGAVDPQTRNQMNRALGNLGRGTVRSGSGGRYIPRGRSRRVDWIAKNHTELSSWLSSKHLDGWCNHEGRAHMPEDFARYLFASCFAQAHSRTPKSRDYPRILWPNHQNFKDSVKEGNLFNDRFRVQVKGSPATTITSHLSRDGHGFIHPDPNQCRTLTPREAARLQTFPDDYFFCGPRTAQYIQIGNAVPPFLATQIAEALASNLI